MIFWCLQIFFIIFLLANNIRVSNRLDSNLARPGLGPNCLLKVINRPWAMGKERINGKEVFWLTDTMGLFEGIS